MTRNRAIPHVSEADRDFVRGLVCYEDDALLVFNKPAGLPVQTRGNRGRNLDHLLWAFARSNGKRPRLVHRIDTQTSGLVLAAKTKPAAVALSDALAERRVEKTYLALVQGDLPRDTAGLIDAALRKPDRDGPPKAEIVPSTHASAQNAETRWRILSRVDDVALIEAQPKTGRMHQIRVHMAHIGLPLLGDTLYGGAGDFAPRTMLHAAGLKFPHPSGEQADLSSALPPDFSDLVDRLGLTMPDA